MKYCITCEKELRNTLTLPDGDEVHPLEIYKDVFIPCYGVFTYSAPPELPEDWELYAVEPDADELEQMNRSAESLLLELR